MSYAILILGGVKLSTVDEALAAMQLTDLFDSYFMQRYTDCPHIHTFIRNSHITLDEKDMIPLDQEAFDQYVKKHTKFNNWLEMKKTAQKIYISQQLVP